jgi:hypothetical protein
MPQIVLHVEGTEVRASVFSVTQSRVYPAPTRSRVPPLQRGLNVYGCYDYSCPDRRVGVDETSYPARAVGKIIFKDMLYCTGTLVGPALVSTTGDPPLALSDTQGYTQTNAHACHSNKHCAREGSKLLPSHLTCRDDGTGPDGAALPDGPDGDVSHPCAAAGDLLRGLQQRPSRCIGHLYPRVVRHIGRLGIPAGACTRTCAAGAPERHTDRHRQTEAKSGLATQSWVCVVIDDGRGL